jgi:hypothetical protein
MSGKVAVVECRRASASGAVTEDRWPGGQVGLRDDWIVVHVIDGDIAFYPRESVVRAWNEPAVHD